MADDIIKITSTGFESAHKVLDNFASKLENPDEKLMKRLGGVVLEDIDRRFMTRGRNTWAPLSPRTISRKGHDSVLIDTGAMFASAQITSLNKGRVSVGVLHGGARHNPEVPGYHQNGTSRIPQRKIIDDTPILHLALIVEIKTWVSDMLAAFKESTK